MEVNYPNRMMSPWPAVKIIKGIPGHPEGAIRYPRPELREQWERQGICVLEQDNRVGRRKKRGKKR